MSLLRWLLLLLAGIGLARAIGNALHTLREQPPASDAQTIPVLLAAALDLPTGQDRVVMVMLQGPDHCEPCARMWRLARQVADQPPIPNLEMRRLELGQARFTSLRRRLGLPFSTLAILRCRPGAPPVWRDLSAEVWRLHTDPPAFTARLRQILLQEGQTP